ncbi:MAG: hypothetical protein ACQ5SW_08440, partial [Sphaerochaetaceae bacterium]
MSGYTSPFSAKRKTTQNTGYISPFNKQNEEEQGAANVAPSVSDSSFMQMERTTGMDEAAEILNGTQDVTEEDKFLWDRFFKPTNQSEPVNKVQISSLADNAPSNQGIIPNDQEKLEQVKSAAISGIGQTDIAMMNLVRAGLKVPSEIAASLEGAIRGEELAPYEGPVQEFLKSQIESFERGVQPYQEKVAEAEGTDKYVLGAVQSAPQMAPAFMGATPAQVMATIGASSFGSGARDAELSGATFPEQITAGAGTAAVEMASEKLPVENIVSMIGGKRTGIEVAKTIGANILEEGIGEAASEAMQPFIEATYNGSAIKDAYVDNLEQTKQNIIDAGLTGATSAVLIGGAAMGVGSVNNAIQNPTPENVQKVAEEIEEITGVPVQSTETVTWKPPVEDSAVTNNPNYYEYSQSAEDELMSNMLQGAETNKALEELKRQEAVQQRLEQDSNIDMSNADEELFNRIMSFAEVNPNRQELSSQVETSQPEVIAAEPVQQVEESRPEETITESTRNIETTTPNRNISDAQQLIKEIISRDLTEYKPNTRTITAPSSASMRGQGKRVGGMVMGAMGGYGGTETVTDYNEQLLKFEELKDNPDQLKMLNNDMASAMVGSKAKPQEYYLKAREYGLDHDKAMVFAIGAKTLMDGDYTAEQIQESFTNKGLLDVSNAIETPEFKKPKISMRDAMERGANQRTETAGEVQQNVDRGNVKDSEKYPEYNTKSEAELREIESTLKDQVDKEYWEFTRSHGTKTPGQAPVFEASSRLYDVRKMLGMKKEFYEMTKEEAKVKTGMPENKHREYVTKAMEEGKTIPSEVLTEYPELVDNSNVQSETDIHIDDRTMEGVGNRKVNAYQYDHPEVKEYIQGRAAEMLEELRSGQKGERTFAYDEGGNMTVTGQSRVQSETIEGILDGSTGRKASYKDIEDALTRLINDQGSENRALAKRIELIIDDNLTDGYKTIDGHEVPPNREYVQVKNGGEEAEAVKAEATVDDMFDEPVKEQSKTKAQMMDTLEEAFMTDEQRKKNRERKSIRDQIAEYIGVVENSLMSDVMDRMSSKEITPEQALEEVKAAVPEETVSEETDPVKAFSESINLEDVNYQEAYSAYTANSFDPDKRAKSEQENYINTMNEMVEKFESKAKTPEQKALLAEELQKFKEGYLKKYNAYIGAKARTMNWAVTGRGNFPVAKNEKAMNTAQKRSSELLEFIKLGEKRITKAMDKTVSPEEKSQAKTNTVLKDVTRSIAMFKSERQQGRKGQFAKDSIKGKLERLAKNGETEAVKQSLDLIKEQAPEMFTARNNIWELVKTAEYIKTAKETETGIESIGTFDGGEIVNNLDEERIQINFDEKPSQEIIDKLKKSGWRWSRKNSAWQRKNTNAAKYSAKSIVGESFEEAGKPKETKKSYKKILKKDIGELTKEAEFIEMAEAIVATTTDANTVEKALQLDKLKKRAHGMKMDLQMFAKAKTDLKELHTIGAISDTMLKKHQKAIDEFEKKKVTKATLEEFKRLVKAEKKITQLKQSHKEQLTEVRRKHRNQVAEEKEKSKQKLQDYKDKKKVDLDRRRDKRDMSQRRTRLLKAIEKLEKDRKKMRPHYRAAVEELMLQMDEDYHDAAAKVFDQFDTKAKSMRKSTEVSLKKTKEYFDRMMEENPEYEINKDIQLKLERLEKRQMN